MFQDDRDLLRHLAAITGLSEAVCERLVAEVNAYQDETVTAYVQRRHGELKQAGLRNQSIYAQLGEEVRERRFAAEALTERQVRRIIYG